MATFASYDTTRLAYHERGSGEPVVCLPGGPMQSSAYLGDLGGLSAHRRLVLLDPRGTGDSAVPADPGTYGCDRQVGDVEALRVHLGLERLTLLGHSAGANLAVLYAAAHPDRLDRLVLVTPSTFAVGLPPTPDERRAIVALRAGEPWYPEAAAAFERLNAGTPAETDAAAIAPLRHGRWTEAARAVHAAEAARRNAEAAARFADGFTPEATRAALSRVDAEVLLVAGELDVNSPPPAVARLAALFAEHTVVTLPRAGHFPWLDDPDLLVRTLVA